MTSDWLEIIEFQPYLYSETLENVAFFTLPISILNISKKYCVIFFSVRYVIRWMIPARA